jgi:hypothetical protein
MKPTNPGEYIRATYISPTNGFNATTLEMNCCVGDINAKKMNGTAHAIRASRILIIHFSLRLTAPQTKNIMSNIGIKAKDKSSIIIFRCFY